MQKKLPSLSEQFNEWYQEVIEAAELADHGPVRGTMVIRPYAYAIWENIQKEIDRQIKEKGVENAYFPLFIPESFLKKEAQHVEGFSPELAVVTHGGGKELEEPVVVRPTSETIIYSMFSKWISSWRDLPFKINQWANVVRWEMRTRLFLRTSEFLWQEGHTAHATYEEADAFAREIQQLYINFAKEFLAIPALGGEKSESERFAGAEHTYTFEGMMQDGKALQMGTSHVLSKSFAEAFDISYQDQAGQQQTPRCTSWGITTRLIGAIIMVHGDDKGLIIPPRIAPIQVVIVPIFRKPEEQERVMIAANDLKKQLESRNIRVKIDSDDRKTPGAKFYHWEVRGVPLRIELGPRDLDSSSVTIAQRFAKNSDSAKQKVALSTVLATIPELLNSMHDALYERAIEYRDNNTHHGDSLASFGSQLEEKGGFYQVMWCGKNACEQEFKTYKATIRCLLSSSSSNSVCCVCFQLAKHEIIVAKSY